MAIARADMQANNKRLRLLMEDVLLLEPNQYADETTSEDVENWDSLGHVSLIVALEGEFKVTIAADDAMLLSIGQIKEFLRSRGVEI